MPDRKKKFDLIRRGEKKPTLSGTLTFVGLRLADIPLQHALLSRSPTAAGSSLGVRILSSLAIWPPHPPRPQLAGASLGWMAPLADLPPTSLLLLLMAAGSAAKQIYWQVALSQESFPAPARGRERVQHGRELGQRAAVPRAGDDVSALAPARLVPVLVAGQLQPAAEHRRRHAPRAEFKSRSENKGKVCKEGLWSWARHVNYFGYALWRGGYCMVGCGWIGGLLMGLWQGWDLSQRAVAVIDEYCSGRYGEQWVRFKQEVPYRIIPGIY
ncbi:hypothetical protein EKO27_g11943 [Xylaria grammica]|uniref:Delta(14)-sterol reductase n=1 Tax=Xylaria grammica TaxID=363999 RepID=A0A439CLX1_9PEZI|nr:hypothetical protein EKO27_g11943 [Xylaria grammica]